MDTRPQSNVTSGMAADLTAADLRDAISAFHARTDGALEASRPEGISDFEWTALKVIARTGRVYCSPATYVKLRREIAGYDTISLGRIIAPPSLGAVAVFVEMGLEDGYLYPDPAEAKRLTDLRIRSDAILQR